MKRRAYTLIDVAVAGAILTLALMALMSVFPTAMMAQRKTEHRFRAGAIAMAILEECRAGDFDALLTHDASADLTTPGALGDVLRRSQQPGDDAVEFKSSITVEPVVAVAPIPNVDRSRLALATVQVAWTEKGGSLTLQRAARIARLQR